MVSAPMAVLKLCGFCLLEAFGFLNKDFGLENRIDDKLFSYGV